MKSANLEVGEGEVYALQGATAASTLIKILGAIYQPDGGEIYIDDKLVKLKASGMPSATASALSTRAHAGTIHCWNIFIGEKPENYGYVSKKDIEARILGSWII